MAPVITPDRCAGCGAPVDGCYRTGDGFTVEMVEALRAEMEEETR